MARPALPPALDLSDQCVLVTGARGGIGAAVARACGALGAELALVDLEAPHALRDELEEEGIRSRSYGADVTRRDTLEAVARAEPGITAAVACAGICPLEHDWLEDEAAWDRELFQVMDVNVLGVLNVARTWLPRMQAAGRGRLVLIGSIAGRMGGTSPIVQPHYVASKGGVHALVWWLARRSAPHGVRVNGVAPGPVATSMTATTPYPAQTFPLGRIGRPEEIAWPVAFLCAPASSYCSGVVLDVNGGLHVG